jgi:hypothetical protein
MVRRAPDNDKDDFRPRTAVLARQGDHRGVPPAAQTKRDILDIFSSLIRLPASAVEYVLLICPTDFAG